MREPACSATDGGVGVGVDEHLDRLGGRAAETFELLGRDTVADGDEPVAMEQRRGAVDLVGGHHLEPGYAVALPHPGTER